MNGFLDRMAAHALGEAPSVHPRMRSRFEPGAGVLPGGPVEPAQEFAEVAEERTFEASRAESSPPRPPLPSPAHPHPGRGGATSQQLEISDGRGFPLSRRGEGGRWERGPGGEDSVRHTFEPPQSLERVLEQPEKVESRLHRDPYPWPPLPSSRLTTPEAAEPQPLRLRSRSALAGELPTLETAEPDRLAPLPPAMEENEPSETVVHVSIGRIDVRAAQPPAPERRPSRPAGPRLTLTDYLKRREERR